MISTAALSIIFEEPLIKWPDKMVIVWLERYFDYDLVPHDYCNCGAPSL